MDRIRHYIYLLCVAVCMMAMQACTDDELLPDGGAVPEGMARLDTEVRFYPLVEALTQGPESRSDGLVLGGEAGSDTGHTVAPSGDMMDQVRSLIVLVYDSSGNLSAKVDPITVDLDTYVPELEDRTDADASNGASAQEATYCVKFPLELPYGNWQIYAVANKPEILTPAYSEAIKTVAGLRGIKLSWVPDDIAANSEMFGFFTQDKADAKTMNFMSSGVVSVRPESKGLHCWLRRAVSKLTIDFDGTGLRPDVKVYIKEARVYDIADGCYLGRYSCVGEPTDKDVVFGGFGFSESAHRLVYGAGSEEDYEKWPVVESGGTLTTYKDKGEEVNFHDELAYCLPFYENMQGRGVKKYQDADSDGTVDYPDAGEYETDADGNPVLTEHGSKKWLFEEAKDRKPNGTYVEVTGYYVSENDNYTSKGPIKYRFMLGKDVVDNYDCERNHHYKLTLKFQGNGNDADWHIEYKEAGGVTFPNPVYISYLYNHSMQFPIRVNTGGRDLEYVRCEITRNNWAPDIPDWDTRPDEDRLDYYRDVDKNNNFGFGEPWNGFLSLLQTSRTQVDPENSKPYETNKSYYNRKMTETESGYDVYRYSRKYLVSPGLHGGNVTDENNGKSETHKAGDYTVTLRKNVVELKVPLYTRAKNLVKATGYTGNNPYVGYPRHAEVNVYVKYVDDEKETLAGTTDVYQVRRLVNPKGVYRDRGNNTTFDVKLMELERESAKTFTPLKSIGPWKAYVVCGDVGFIDLGGKAEVTGENDEEVAFPINFHGETPEDDSRFAVVRVEYHNFSCYHLIFVRQGDAPVRLFDEKVEGKQTYWHTYNMWCYEKGDDKRPEVENVLDEGSLFRYVQWFGIDASNQKYTNKADNYWVSVSPDDFKGQVPAEFKMSNADAMSWDGIGSKPYGSREWTDYEITRANGAKESYELPLVEDYILLRRNTEQGFGVLYGDAATGVKSDVREAYGYQRDAQGVADGACGMRGVFVYRGAEGDPDRGAHTFFPIGASGYGRRKHKGVHAFGDSETESGVLRYASGRTGVYKVNGTDNPEAVDRPLFYDLYMRPGAVYWAKKTADWVEDGENNANCLGLDINYFTFDFSPIVRTNLFGERAKESEWSKSDACLIRCVDRR